MNIMTTKFIHVNQHKIRSNLKHKKKSEVCNHVWKPLNLHESNSEIKEERATQNFQNYQSTLNDRGNKDSPDYWHERHD